MYNKLKTWWLTRCWRKAEARKKDFRDQHDPTKALPSRKATWGDVHQMWCSPESKKLAADATLAYNKLMSFKEPGWKWM